LAFPTFIGGREKKSRIEARHKAKRGSRLPELPAATDKKKGGQQDYLRKENTVRLRIGNLMEKASERGYWPPS